MCSPGIEPTSLFIQSYLWNLNFEKLTLMTGFVVQGHIYFQKNMVLQSQITKYHDTMLQNHGTGTLQVQKLKSMVSR